MFRHGSNKAKEIQQNETKEQGPPPWKKTIDDALLLFKYMEITMEGGKMKELTMDPDDLEGVVKKQLIKLCYRLCNELDQVNINKYRSYRDEYKEDTFDLWRKDEMFTPVLYLAKASPFGSVAMLKIMIAKGADLKLQASTVGCRILSFFCTSIAKLSLKNYTYYMIRIEGEYIYAKKYLAPKTLGVYDSLVKINKGDNLEFQDWEKEIFQRNKLETNYNTQILALKNNIPYISTVQYTHPVKTVRNSIIYGAGIALFFSSALIIGVISASAFIVLTPLSQPLRVLKLHKNQERIEFNNIIINSAKRSGLTQEKKNEIIQQLNTDICRQKDCYIKEAQAFVGVQQLDTLPSLPKITPEELTQMNKALLADAVQQAKEAATIAGTAAQEVMGGGTTTPAATAATAAAATANAAAATAVTLAKSAQGNLPATIKQVNESVQQAEQAAAVAVTQATQMNTPTGASSTGTVGAVNTGTATLAAALAAAAADKLKDPQAPVTDTTATESNEGVQPLPKETDKLDVVKTHNAHIKNSQFFPVLDSVITNTENVTLRATKALKNKGIDDQVLKFEEKVRTKILETRRLLDEAKTGSDPATGQGARPGQGAQGLVPGQGAQGLVPVQGAQDPVPGQGAQGLVPVQGAPLSTRNLGVKDNVLVPTNSNVLGASAMPQLIGNRSLTSPSDKLNLLRILNESLINTIKQVIEQMGTANTDFIRRALGYIQILLIQLQNLALVFNRLDQRIGKIEKNLRIPYNTSTNTSEPELEALREQLEKLMVLDPAATPTAAPAAAPAARNPWFRNPFARTQTAGRTKGSGRRKTRACKRKTRCMPRRRKKSSAKTRKVSKRNTPARLRKWAGHKKASRRK